MEAANSASPVIIEVVGTHTSSALGQTRLTWGIQWGMPEDDSRGRPPDPDSLRQQMERGEAKAVKVVLSEGSYRALKVQSALTDRTMSEMVEEAVEQWLSRQDAAT